MRKVYALTRICRFIVMQNSVMKYSTRIGQNTGMLNMSKHVHSMPMQVLLLTAYQNLNSGRRRMNGRNSSLERVGSSGPPSSAAGRCRGRTDGDGNEMY